MNTAKWTAIALLLLAAAADSTIAQPGSPIQTKLTGGPWVGGLGLFNFDRSTTDLGLSMGGAIQASLNERTAFSTSLGFLANVDDNDAFDDRSALFSAGLEYRFLDRRLDPFLGGGYAVAAGGVTTRHLGYVGGGIRKWYAERVGWQMEIRDYLSGEVNLIEFRLGIMLR